MSRSNPGRGDAPLVEGVDFELDPHGRMVFTAHFLKQRGFCCFLACRHCPYGQAGRRPPEAEADRRRRLATLGERLAARGLRPTRLDYVNGVLRIALEQEPATRGDWIEQVRREAADLLPLLRVQAD
jgi:hypothetical protein